LEVIRRTESRPPSTSAERFVNVMRLSYLEHPGTSRLSARSLHSC
jgi:hypothetical protein